MLSNSPALLPLEQGVNVSARGSSPVFCAISIARRGTSNLRAASSTLIGSGLAGSAFAGDFMR